MQAEAEIPRLALGTWQVPDGARVAECVGRALEAGYRHIDTAQRYENEAGVGRGVAESDLARDQVFVTTKFDPQAGDPVAEARRSLERLGMDYIDLYLVHWPMGDPLRHWPGMIRAKEAGLTRQIGVSNYGAVELEELCAATDVPPAVNQVQLSPFEYRRGLLGACARLGVTPAAWSPLTRGERLADPVVTGIADAAGRTPAQVLLRWGIQRGAIVIPKSADPKRIAENARIFDFELTELQMARLDALDETAGTDRAQERPSLLRRVASRLRR